MAKKRARLAPRRKNTVAEWVLCLFGAALLLGMGIMGIDSGMMLAGGTRSTPGTPVYGDEAMTRAVGCVLGATLLLLWLFRHSRWLPWAIGVAIAANLAAMAVAFR